MSSLRKIGIIHVTGEPDSGKSTFLFGCGVKPERMAVFDADLKGSSVAQTLEDMGHPFGLFVNMIKETKDMRELEYLAFFRDKLSKIKSGEFDVIVFDGWSRLENCLHPYVEANPKKFRLKYSSLGAIKGAQMWQAAGQLEATILQDMLDLVPVLQGQLLMKMMEAYRLSLCYHRK